MAITKLDLFVVPRGYRLLIATPRSLGTTWSWRIVDDESPSSVIEYKTVILPTSQRHDFVTIGTQYELDKLYRVQVLDNTLTVVLEGVFVVEEAVFGPSAVTDFDEVNSQLQLALGLAGANQRVQVTARDQATGIPTDMTITVYSDKTLTEVLAIFRLRRRLDKVSCVIAEVQYPTFLQATSQPTGTGA